MSPPLRSNMDGDCQKPNNHNPCPSCVLSKPKVSGRQRHTLNNGTTFIAIVITGLLTAYFESSAGLRIQPTRTATQQKVRCWKRRSTHPRSSSGVSFCVTCRLHCCHHPSPLYCRTTHCCHGMQRRGQPTRPRSFSYAALQAVLAVKNRLPWW